MKKVLFLIQWYPSVLSANALCDEKIIRELKDSGEYEIHCVCYKPFGAKKEENIDGVFAHRFTRGLWWNCVIWAKQNIKSRIAQIVLMLDRLVSFARIIITMPLYPYTTPVANWRFFRKAKKEFLSLKPDLIISEFHGLDCLYAGRKLKKNNPGIPFVAVLWDAYTGRKLPKHLPKSYSNRRIIAAEERDLSVADCIVVMKSNEEYQKAHANDKAYYGNMTFLDIVGIVNPERSDLQSSFIDKEKINIVYAGILSLPDRDPEYIIKALNLSQYASQIRLIFLCTGAGRNKLKTLSCEFKGEIIDNGYVTRAELNSIYWGADVLLNFGNPFPNMVPSKIFEYLSYGKPIMSTYWIDGDTSKHYLDSYSLACCVDQRKPLDETATRIDTFLTEIRGKILPFDWVKNEFKENTPKAYVDLIDNLVRQEEK